MMPQAPLVTIVGLPRREPLQRAVDLVRYFLRQVSEPLHHCPSTVHRSVLESRLTITRVGAASPVSSTSQQHQLQGQLPRHR